MAVEPGRSDVEMRASARFTLSQMIERELDPVSRARLRALQVGHDARAWRCLVVGAGTGSMAQWLADEVGSRGTVLVTDAEQATVDHVQAHRRPNVTALRCDLAGDGPATPLSFDLVHCRLVLAHLHDPAAALRVLADAVAPGGVLLVEEYDHGPLTLCDDTRSDAQALRAAHTLLTDHARDLGVDLTLGRRLLQLVEQTELTNVEHSATCRIWRGGGEAANVPLFVTSLLAPALPPSAELHTWTAALRDPGFAMVSPTLHSVSARRAPL